MNQKLAIVIPAYKVQFFYEALESVARQSCKDFTLYIGDDASPDNLRSIVDKFVDKMDIVYHRFNTNTGQKELAKQWERCIELSSEEEYIWLFSDDDIMPENGVELFYKAIAIKNGFDLYRFNIRQIDTNGLFISDSTNHPEIEPAENFIYRRLKGETLSAACEYIFSREVYQKTGGFVHFPLAWCTDDASWYLFAKESGIYTIKDGPVCWRISETNISKPGESKVQKYKSTLLFYEWVREQHISDRVKNMIPYSLRRQSVILKISLLLFLKHFIRISKPLGFAETIWMSFYMVKQQINRLRIII